MEQLRSFTSPFDISRCKECGECLHQCPVLQMTPDEAISERKKLNSGSVSAKIMKRCTTCFACNLVCPQGCNPAQQIIDLWHNAYRSKGLPLRARYFDPNHSTNFRTYVVDRLPYDERAMIEKWKDTSECAEILYPGCNIITAPYLTQTSLLEGLEIRGSLDVCCGETYYRMGLIDEMYKVAERLERYFKKLGVRKMIIPCTAGRNMFTNVLPSFGVKFDFEVVHILPWLWERMEKGKIVIKEKLNMTVTVQESCYGKIFGNEYMDIPRKILNRIGVQVIEEKLSRSHALCCGIAGGFSIKSGYHPVDIAHETFRSLGLAKQTGADAIAVYCAGCLQMLTVGQILYPFNRMPVYHILELLQMAIGEKPARLNKKRAQTLFTGVLKNQVPLLFSLSRHRVDVKKLDF
ncbi:MAG TPA: (Fe-S)-binding protein [Spirochaetota bacterium]|nr:(Fe-S)-binding protein [Spirochaetota bacterium]